MDWIWIFVPLTALSIPIIAILSSAFEKIAKAQAQQAGPVIEEVTADLAILKEQHQRDKQRISNLEAIVIAQAEQISQLPALSPANERYPAPDFGQLQDQKDDQKLAAMVEQLKK
jgi:hypothetical protein